MSNNILLEGEDYASYGIICEAYDREFYEKHIPVHISDCHILYNYGFLYGSNPAESIRIGEPLIVLLTHPSHWGYGIYERIKILLKIIMGRYKDISDKKFARISGGSISFKE
jgi:hypothetical protein